MVFYLFFVIFAVWFLIKYTLPKWTLIIVGVLINSVFLAINGV